MSAENADILLNPRHVAVLAMAFLAFFTGLLAWNKLYSDDRTPPFFRQFLWSAREAPLIVASFLGLLGDTLWELHPVDALKVALLAVAFLVFHGMEMAQLASLQLSGVGHQGNHRPRRSGNATLKVVRPGANDHSATR